MRAPWLMLVLALVLLGQCANPVAPTGGEKDEQPPICMSVIPASGTTSFQTSEIVFHFDEFIQLKSKAAIIVSPPMTGKIEYRVKGRRLKVLLPDSLRKNTTYTFAFGNSISDLNEGNPIDGLNYVFSTGDRLDSLSLAGEVIVAGSGLPASKTWVLLYEAEDDTMTGLPAYVTQTNENGSFRLEHLPARQFQMRGLREDVLDYQYLRGKDEVAFTTQRLVSPMDSQELQLRLFKETAAPRLLKTYARPGQAIAVFSSSVSKASLSGVHLPSAQSYSVTRDTIRFWFAEPAPDSMRWSLSYNGSTEQVKALVPPLISEQEQFRFHCAVSGSLLPGSSILLRSPWPLSSSQAMASPFRLDSLDPRKLWVDTETTDTFLLHLGKGAYRDFLDRSSDTLKRSFPMVPATQLGELLIDVPDMLKSDSIIVEVSDNQAFTGSLWSVPATQDVRFSHLRPGQYWFRVVVDTNGDKRWTTGSLSDLRQPERLHGVVQQVTIRANWTIEADIK